MASNGTDILIRILTAYEAGGMEAARRAAEDLCETIDGASEGGKTLSGIMDMMNGNAGAASQVFNGLSGVMRGGAGAASGMATAIKGIGSAIGIASGPLALLAGAVSLGITLWNKHAEASRKAAEEAQKAAEEEKKAAEEAAKALEESMASASKSVRDDIKGIADGFKDALSEAKALDDAMQSLDDAELGLELARLDEQIENASTPEEKAELEHKKVEAKAQHAARKRERKISQIDAETDTMDEGEAAAKKYADEKAAALETPEFERWKKAAAKVEETQDISAAWLAANQPGAGDEERLALEAAEAAAAVAQEEEAAARAALPQAPEVMRSEMQAARDEYEQLQGRNAPHRKILEAQRKTLRVEEQTENHAFNASDRQIDRETKEERDRLDKEKQDKKRQDAIDRDKGRTVDERIAYAQGFVQNAQAVGGEVYRGGQSGAETKARANAAIEAAGREIAAGGDDLAVIQKLVSALEQMGAVVSNYRTLISQLDKMDGKIDHVASQFQNSRS